MFALKARFAFFRRAFSYGSGSPGVLAEVFDLSEEVRSCLIEGRPVVALESTIITHGMPYPDNVKCAKEVEAIIRKQNVVPATIAILKGRIKVGLSDSDLEELGDVKKSQPIKTSRRDLSFVIANRRNGGTTVSGTLIVASNNGIPIFATGGIGGVHRGVEETMDISADLIELGRSHVAVVSSGVKSILDIPKTLEYLETQGVFVATLGNSNDFPAFYSRKSGWKTPYFLSSVKEAARVMHAHMRLKLESGMLIAVPVPREHALDDKTINESILKALELAKTKGITGKDITPFLLGQISETTQGKSLETNIALIKNNAKTASEIAVELHKLQDVDQQMQESAGARIPAGVKKILSKQRRVQEGVPVLIGGTNLDCYTRLRASQLTGANEIIRMVTSRRPIEKWTEMRKDYRTVILPH